jgi:6-phosphogluconolactonase
MRIYLVNAVTLLLALHTLSLAKGQQPDKMHAYIGTYTNGNSRGVYLCELDPSTGELKNLGLAGEAKSPSFLALHPNGRFLYAVSEVGGEGAVIAFAIDPRTHKLRQLNSQPSAGVGPCHVTLDRAGRHAFVANYGSGTIAALPIGTDGKLMPPFSTVQHEGSSVNKDRQAGPHAHAIYPSPDQRFVLSADLGVDKIFVYRLDSSGAFVANNPPFAAVDPGAGPRHLAFHPSGKWLYSINELASTVTVFAYDSERGALTSEQTVSTLPEGEQVDNTTAEIVVHPNGKYLYGSNRGHDSIAIFAIDQANGRLTAIGHQPTGGHTPRNFAIDPSGGWLLAANQASGDITVHRIDAATGKLEATGQAVQIDAPVCVEFVRGK